MITIPYILRSTRVTMSLLVMCSSHSDSSRPLLSRNKEDSARRFARIPTRQPLDTSWPILSGGVFCLLNYDVERDGDLPNDPSSFGS